MNAEMIEELKQNETPWGFLSKKKQDYLKKVAPGYCIQLSLSDGNEHWFAMRPDAMFARIYRLRKDYQPEPEIERCEVYSDNGWVWYKREDGRERILSCAVDDPDFIDAEDKNGNRMGVLRCIYPSNKPAEIPAFLLFRKQAKSCK